MLPINIDIGNFHRHNYEGIYFFIGIVAAIIYFTYLLKEANIDVETMYEASFVSILVGLITGRIFSFVFWYPEQLIHNPLSLLLIWNGGLSITGSMAGGLISGYIYARVKKLDYFYHIQYFIPPILLGQTIGRFGCFLNGDCGGKPTDMPWGMVFHKSSVAYFNIAPGTPLHPTQLYEVTGTLILFIFIVLSGNSKWITKRRIIWYAFGYSIIRFIVEFFRNDSVRWNWLPVFTTGQIISIFGFILGVGMLIWSLVYPDKLEVKEEFIARPTE